MHRCVPLTYLFVAAALCNDPVCGLRQTDLEDQANELRNAEDAAKKAMSDAARLAEEVRQEQEHATHIEKMRRTLEGQVRSAANARGPSEISGERDDEQGRGVGGG